MRGKIAISSMLFCVSSATLHSSTVAPVYGTFFGGGAEAGMAVASDSSGNVIIAGTTTSNDLKGTAGRFQPNLAPGPPGSADVFIAKFDSTGRALMWATYLGGDGDDLVTGLALDSSGSIYLIGTTTSTNFPFTPNAYGTSGQSFAAKISNDGKALLYATSLPITPSAGVVNGAGEFCIVGLGSFTTPGALSAPPGPNSIGPQSGPNLIKLNTGGSQIVFGALLGNNETFSFSSEPTSMAFDQNGNIYVGGTTNGGMLTTPTSLQPTYANTGLASLGVPLNNGFLIEVDPTATEILYGTYFGAVYANTSITNVVVGSNGAVFFGGSTNGTSYSATAGAAQTSAGGGFIAALSATGSAIRAFSYLPSDLIAMTLGSDGSLRCIDNVIPYLASFGAYGSFGVHIAFFQISTIGLSLVGTTPLFDNSAQLAVDPNNNTWIIGTSSDLDNYGALFVTPDAFQQSLDGPSDAFFVEITTVSPSVSLVVNAAAETSHFAVGELISIYGTQLGPATGSGIQLAPDGAVTTSNAGTQVLFDGTAAPILYAGADQVNAAIPCVLAGQSSAQIVVDYMGAQSAPVTVQLSPAAPGIFTADGTGQGQAAALNQDNSFNSPSKPAPGGSIVAFYATGVGPTSPCMDGATYQSNFPILTLPVVVGVGSSGAHVDYAGQAPDLVSGVAQFNIVIPSDAPSGVLPLTLIVGGVYSTPGVTIAVK